MLLFIDGFDHLGALAGNLIVKWHSSGNLMTPQTGGGPRTGTHHVHGISTTGAFMLTKVLPVNPGAGAIAGFAIKTSVFDAGGADICRVMEGAITHVALAATGAGLLQIKRGATVIATGTTALVINSYYFIELKAVIGAAGSYEVHIDGTPEAALTASGVNTQNGGTGAWSQIRLSGPSADVFFDDVYICDTFGPAPQNDFLGPVKIETLFPQTDAVAVGSNQGLTPSTAPTTLDHGALVDETAPNTTDYNGSATVGLKDTYNYPPMTLTGAILGIQANLYVQKSDAGARQICPVLRVGGSDSDGANQSPLTSWGYITQAFGKKPSGGDWTDVDIATLEVGMKVAV